MSYFRDFFDDEEEPLCVRTPYELLETARWYNWCGDFVAATSLLTRIAAGIEEKHIPYEDRPYKYEQQEEEQDFPDGRGNWE